jgi:subtilisin family serine protease
VGVIDTGIDYNHPDLAANIWTNPGEIPGNGIDDDHNGYVDDIHGWNFAAEEPDASANPASNDPMDGYFHGTVISGTIGAVTGNGIGVAGLCPFVSLMACKGLSDKGEGYTSDLIYCIYYAVDNGALVMNASWGGGGYSRAMEEAISYAENHNAIFVAAAGNNAMNTDIIPFYPASYPNGNIVAVAASDTTDLLTTFSNWGKTTVDIAAPGSAILSTVPNNGYTAYSGTSNAAPFVSGTLALMMGCAPGLSSAYYIETMLSTVDCSPACINRVASTGRLNTNRSLVALLRNRRGVPFRQADAIPQPVLKYLSAGR